MNIYEKLAAITSELNAVAKNLMVGEGRSSYKAVSEADVLAAVKPLEQKYKVYSYPLSRKVIDSDIITTKKVYNGQESEISKFFMRVETVYRFVNTEDPADYVDITTYGDGVDSNDKAPGKAMTYGDKYALLKAYKIITGDDPDQNRSDEGKVTRGGYNVEPGKPGERVPPVGDTPIKCQQGGDDCGTGQSQVWGATLYQVREEGGEMNLTFTQSKISMEDGLWLCLKVNETAPAREFVLKKQNKLYDCKIKQHRDKRSMNANDYCWVLLDKMADALHTTKEELYIQ